MIKIPPPELKKNMRAQNIFLCFLYLFFLSSCGYQFGSGTQAPVRTLSVPYVIGDTDGSLTASLINYLSRSGVFEYRQSDGAGILKVKLLDFRDENIGFRYDRNQNGRLTKSIIPTETRLSGLAEVVVVDACSGCILLGPTVISTSVEFDHEYYSSRDGINVFSLGQLTDIDEARDAAQSEPLNQELARMIVDYLINSW